MSKPTATVQALMAGRTAVKGKKRTKPSTKKYPIPLRGAPNGDVTDADEAAEADEPSSGMGIGG